MQTIITIITVLNMYLNILQDCSTSYCYNADIDNGIVKTMYVYDRIKETLSPKLAHHFTYDNQGRVTEKATYRWNPESQSYQASHRLQMTYTNDSYELAYSVWGKNENDWKASNEKTIYKHEKGKVCSVKHIQINHQGEYKILDYLSVLDPSEDILLACSAVSLLTQFSNK